MARPTGWLHTGLLLYLAVTVLVGVWAAGWPRSFYDDFPWLGHPGWGCCRATTSIRSATSAG
jgi:hypothetical protein